MRQSHQRLIGAAVIVFILLASWWRLRMRSETAEFSQHRYELLSDDTFRKSSILHPKTYSQTLVVASTQDEDTSWIAEELPSINHAIYVADDLNAPLHPPINKGRESMMYLTYIIDHYNNLTDTTIFIHAQRDSWHNNEVQSNSLATMVLSISNEHVERSGFWNLRCHHESGCPDHIRPFASAGTHDDKTEEEYFAQAWAELHGPGIPVPEVVAAACCSQFAVSREALLSVSLDRWIKYRQWFLDTELTDEVSGRIWEFTWHFVLTGLPVLCPKVSHCYCDGYGLCFEGEGELMAYLAMKEVEELAKETQKEFKEREKDTGALDYRLWQKIQRPALKWLHEAELRGQDPKTRARLSGREKSWKEGDGF